MKLVKENIERFERGLDPKKAMGTGIEATIMSLLKKLVNVSEGDKITILNIDCNRWEIVVNVVFHTTRANTKILDQIIKKIGNLEHFLIIPAHSITQISSFAGILYKFKPQYVGLFDMGVIKITEAMEFQRGLQPKEAMGTGIGAALQKYAEEHIHIFADDFSNEYVEILDHLVNSGEDPPNEAFKEQKKIFINWLLQRVDLKYLDESIMEGLKEMEWNLVPFYKKLPDDNFTFLKHPTSYTLITSDWSNFTDYFQKNSSRNSDYEKYIDNVLRGDAYNYFNYNYADDYENNLDVSKLQYGSPSEFGDIILELKKLKISRKQLEMLQKAKHAAVMFDFIWEKANTNNGYLNLKEAIMRATGETIQAGNEYAAFRYITKLLIDHFDMKLLKISVDLKFKISEKGLNQFIYAYYLNDEKVRYIEKDTYRDFDLSVFHDCFDFAINN